MLFPVFASGGVGNGGTRFHFPSRDLTGLSECRPVTETYAAALAGPAGNTPDMTMKPLMRFTRSHQRRIAG
ncbi:hypothetical protein MPLDJ20_20350 [Mesorhizobium plurifarium]|uniref:Uncharacterized protein n=1 Tax=Mesorhizobium plurifarium TaxID=69974 RepID=A0A090EW98_MESPL|nr:hypothetical protein MPLDJ20_20350 [Mesorhizobium plurifarium]